MFQASAKATTSSWSFGGKFPFRLGNSALLKQSLVKKSSLTQLFRPLYRYKRRAHFMQLIKSTKSLIVGELSLLRLFGNVFSHSSLSLVNKKCCATKKSNFRTLPITRSDQFFFCVAQNVRQIFSDRQNVWNGIFYCCASS